jgi:hypothetical protein
MGDHAVLSPVQAGDIWRVQIIWPNGKRHIVGEFSSEDDAAEWIRHHEWWLAKPEDDPQYEQSKPSSAA